jgi:hypothetical protein
MKVLQLQHIITQNERMHKMPWDKAINWILQT